MLIFVLVFFVYISFLNYLKVGFFIFILELWKLRFRGKRFVFGYLLFWGRVRVRFCLGLFGFVISLLVRIENFERNIVIIFIFFIV